MGDQGLTLENVEIRNGQNTLISINTHIAPGEVLTIMGPSGVGKSTLLSYVIGNLPPGFDAKGRIVLDGHDITHLPTNKRRVGILFQDDLLFPHMSVGENLSFGLHADIKGRAVRRMHIEAALTEINLEGFANRDPETLSGGQKARVALMRMLLSNPCALLLDEAFARLDTKLRGQVRNLVFEYARKRDLPTLMVTHDQADADAAGGECIHLLEFGKPN
ncbi:ATP-binding cassette domain-containing protein [Parasulfitobacter algicola]|uniref:ATP-binding cassette domain-containing protein n=1 Tax=Parasulfitobacter algicola TaxID=2614809 RepID=A0ABX2IZW9_9RHOB|nr:ATP-binding cassette domain-containing protein [Sulfitobacter algicola]NSX56334.1 ATP-binding cassette domain-containing protein [Sulfitobacter algicola]